MSWIDQGRQRHGWFGHGTSSPADSGELRARAFAAVPFAADELPSRDRLPFPLEKTTEVLRTFASIMASEAGLAPNDFRLRFFRASFDPVDAWGIQLVMRDIAAADTHARLVRLGQELATVIRAHGPEGWNALLTRAVAQVDPAPPAAAASGGAKVQKAQFAIPAAPAAAARDRPGHAGEPGDDGRHDQDPAAGRRDHQPSVREPAAQPGRGRRR